MPNRNVVVNVKIPEIKNDFSSGNFEKLTPYVVRNRLDNNIYVAIKVYNDYLPSNGFSTLLIEDGAFRWASDPSKLEVIRGAEAEVSFDVVNP